MLNLKPKDPARRSISGFTLIEITLVLLVATILLGYTVGMYPLQQELKQYKIAEAEMDSILQYLIRFAQINGRLPCPDTNSGGSTIDGEEDSNGSNGCKAFFGYLPAKSLGINGDFKEGLLLDPWGIPYRYAVSKSNANVSGSDADIDFVTRNGIKNEGIVNAIPDLFICDDSAATGNDLDCAAASSNIVAGNVAAVVISTGKDRNKVGSNIQAENTDDFHNGGSDKVFVYAPRNDSSGNEYDDIVKWISPNLLISKMIEADQLP